MSATRTMPDQERGLHSELRALMAIRRLGEPWIYDARLATRREDAKGIDIVVSCDVGNLYLQVKSSRTGMNSWRRKNEHFGGQRNVEYGQVIVHRQLHDDDLAERIRAELLRVRNLP